MKKFKSLIGKQVDILSGMYKGEWGTIRDYDGDYYYIALWDDSDSILAYEPDEINIRKQS